LVATKQAASVGFDLHHLDNLILVFIDRPLSIRVERCQPIQRVEVGLQFDCPNAGCAIAIGVLIMRWLQVSIEFRPSVAGSRPISFGRLRICSRNRGDFFCLGASAMLTLDPSSETRRGTTAQSCLAFACRRQTARSKVPRTGFGRNHLHVHAGRRTERGARWTGARTSLIAGVASPHALISAFAAAH
jgi:hypothetical protein